MSQRRTGSGIRGSRAPLAAALLLAALSWSAAAPPVRAEADAAPAAAPEARQTVEELHGELLEAMRRAEELGYAGREELLGPVLRDVYDLDYMARKSVGRHWSKLSEAEQQRFLETFRQLTVANYAGRFSGWSGEAFETLQVENGVHDTLLVKTRLVRPEDEPVHLDYRLHRTDGGWRIIDVYLNGTISELALRRSEYSAILRREGFASLLQALDEKIADLKQGKG